MEGKRNELNEPVGRSKIYLSGFVQKLIFLLGALTIAGPVWSLGLGNLEVNSNLDEPLDIRIELVSGSEDELATAEAALASGEEFDLIGLQRPDYLDGLVFTIVPAGEGDTVGGFSGAYLQLTSDSQMKEPFMHFLVRLNWSGGRLLREYTALIDPPVYAAEVPTQISSPRIVNEAPVVIDAAPMALPAVESTSMGESGPGEAAEEVAPVSADPEADLVVSDQSGNSVVFVEDQAVVERSADGSYATYGPTAEGDTLSNIASQLSAQFTDIDMYQVMYVLVRDNPDAFIDGNMNLLMKGQILQLSDLGTVREVPAEEARSEFRVHLAQWDGYADFAAQSGGTVLIPGDGDSAFVDNSGAASGTGLDVASDAPGESSVGGVAGPVDEFGIGADVGESGAFDSSDTAIPDSDEQFRIGSAGGTEGFADDQGVESNGDGQEVLTLRGEVAELESALFSSNLENDDLRQRVALLEDQLNDVNTLISLGDADLASLQSSVSGDGSLPESVQDAANGEIDTDVAEAAGDAEMLTDAAPVDEAGNGEEGTAITGVADQAVDPVPAPSSESGPAESVAAAVVTQTATMNTKSWWARLVESLQGVSSLVMTLVGLFVVGLAGLIYLRRRRALEEFEHSMLSIGVDSITAPTQVSASQISGDVEHIEVSDEETNTTRESSFLTVYSDSEVVVHADEVDPIAEADVYLAYGRDQQAEEVLVDGMSKFRDRDDIKLKLLTIYRKRKDVGAFETLAEELYPTDSAASRDTWELVARMGRKLSPTNPLFNDAPPEFSESGQVISGLEGEGTLDKEGEESTPDGAETGIMEFDTEFEAEAAVPDEGADDSETEETADASNLDGGLPDGLEFNLQDEIEKAKTGEQDIELETVADEMTAVMDSLELDEEVEYDLSADDSADEDALEDQDISEGSIDLELDSEETEDVAKSESEEAEELPVGLSKERSEVIEFTPELTARREQMSAKNQSASKDDGLFDDGVDSDKNEFETQIELAKVFIELGDKDGARKILSEVINDGGSDHRRAAEKLMSAINE